jgi:oligoribonuclease NrnB/cAMP/cGMP phosphodiesterase (DHH superfamily)
VFHATFDVMQINTIEKAAYVAGGGGTRNAEISDLVCVFLNAAYRVLLPQNVVVLCVAQTVRFFW